MEPLKPSANSMTRYTHLYQADELGTQDVGYRYTPNVDDHSTQADTGDEQLHVTVEYAPLSVFVECDLVKGSVVVAPPGVLRHEAAEDRHRDYTDPRCER